MELEDQNVSLELAKQLREWGAPQDSLWVWNYNGFHKSWELGFSSKREKEREIYNCYSAYTVAELGEMLPFVCQSYKDKFDGWQCVLPIESSESGIIGDTLWGPISHASRCRISDEAKTEADARAKMLILLLKEKPFKQKNENRRLDEMSIKGEI